jgi:hypothetical protein
VQLRSPENSISISQIPFSNICVNEIELSLSCFFVIFFILPSISEKSISDGSGLWIAMGKSELTDELTNLKMEIK